MGNSATDDEALAELAAAMDARIARTWKTGVSDRTVDEIFEQSYREAEANA